MQLPSATERFTEAVMKSSAREKWSGTRRATILLPPLPLPQRQRRLLLHRLGSVQAVTAASVPAAVAEMPRSHPSREERRGSGCLRLRQVPMPGPARRLQLMASIPRASRCHPTMRVLEVGRRAETPRGYPRYRRRMTTSPRSFVSPKAPPRPQTRPARRLPPPWRRGSCRRPGATAAPWTSCRWAAASPLAALPAAPGHQGRAQTSDLPIAVGGRRQ